MYKNFSILTDSTISKIERFNPDKYGDELLFYTNIGTFKMYHEDDCCESVNIEDICGDICDIVNAKVILAEESLSDDPPLDDNVESYTWTFYRLVTDKGDLTIRWYGVSNGYYSESVSFKQID